MLPSFHVEWISASKILVAHSEVLQRLYERQCGWLFCTAGDSAAAAQFLLPQHLPLLQHMHEMGGLSGINTTREQQWDSDVF